MSEVECTHIKAVAASAKKAADAERAYLRAMHERNEAIRVALSDRVSDRAVAIAAVLNRTMVWQISSKEDDPLAHVREDEVTQDVHAVGTEYPCCGRQARFSKVDEALDVPLVRFCRECKTSWTVERRPLVQTHRGRVDNLVWSKTGE